MQKQGDSGSLLTNQLILLLNHFVSRRPYLKKTPEVVLWPHTRMRRCTHACMCSHTRAGTHTHRMVKNPQRRTFFIIVCCPHHLVWEGAAPFPFRYTSQHLAPSTECGWVGTWEASCGPCAGSSGRGEGGQELWNGGHCSLDTGLSFHLRWWEPHRIVTVAASSCLHSQIMLPHRSPFLQSPKAKKQGLLEVGRVAALELRQVANGETPGSFGEAGKDLVFIMGPLSAAGKGIFSKLYSYNICAFWVSVIIQ